MMNFLGLLERIHSGQNIQKKRIALIKQGSSALKILKLKLYLLLGKIYYKRCCVDTKTIGQISLNA